MNEMFWFVWEHDDRTYWSLVEKSNTNYGTILVSQDFVPGEWFSLSSFYAEGKCVSISDDEAYALRALIALAPERVTEHLPDEIRAALT